MTRTVWSLYREALRQNGDVYHFHDSRTYTPGALAGGARKTVVYEHHEGAPGRYIAQGLYSPISAPALTWSVRKIGDAALPPLFWLVAATPAIAKRFYSN